MKIKTAQYLMVYTEGRKTFFSSLQTYQMQSRAIKSWVANDSKDSTTRRLLKELLTNIFKAKSLNRLINYRNYTYIKVSEHDANKPTKKH